MPDARFGGRDILDALAPLFQPEHVAVVGASRTPGKSGNTVVRFIKQAGFPGRISPINPSGGEIEGLPAYASIGQAPSGVDCAILVIPAQITVEAVRECAAAGVKSIIVASAEFAELGTDEGRAREAEVAAIAQEAGMIVLGPNTNGIFNAQAHLSLGYSNSHGDPIQPGPVSVAAHSGALLNGFYPRLREFGVGMSKFVPVGNEADLTMLDFLEYFIADPDTRVIGLVIEAIADGERFRTLAERARAAGKPVVALKLGKSDAGAEAALAHSSRLAGSARAYEALFRACGVAGVPTVEALAGGCAILANRSKGATDGDQSLIGVTGSGAGGAMLADFASERGMTLAGDGGRWGGTVAEKIETFAGAGLVRNPIDLGNLRGHGLLAELFAAQEADGLTGPVVFYAHPFPNPMMNDALAEMLCARRKRVPTPVVLVSPGGLGGDIESAYTQGGIPVFHDLATCMDSLACHYQTLPAPDVEAASAPAPDVGTAVSQVEAAAKSGRRILTEQESAEILRAAGVPMVESIAAETVNAALDIAETIGYPLVMKALAPDVAHKAALGLVVTGIEDVRGLAEAYADLEDRIAAQGFERAATQIILQPMVGAKAELIAGLTLEDGLGYFLVAGLGGVYTEVLDEVVLFPVPSDPGMIRRGLDGTRTGALFRALGVADDVMSALAALQALAVGTDGKIESVDVNPLVVTESGCTAVDALVTLRDR